jgi:hypothetical protein
MPRNISGQSGVGNLAETGLTHCEITDNYYRSDMNWVLQLGCFLVKFQALTPR